MKNREIIHSSELDEKSLTFSDLRFLYSTGRSYTISGSGRNRSTGYRNGVMTPVGDLEISEWSALMHRLIDRAEEREIYDALCSGQRKIVHGCITKANGSRKLCSFIPCVSLKILNGRLMLRLTVSIILL